MKHISRWFFIISTATIFILTGITLINTPAQKPETPSSTSSISTIDISLNNISLEDLDTSTKDVVFSGNSISITTPTSQAYLYDNVNIRLRGNSTYLRPKKPYQIKFNTKTSLYGLSSSKTWILFSHYYDPTGLRNYTASLVGDLLGFHDILYGEHAELYINGDYRGLYYLTPKINTSTLHLDDDTAIIAELDKLHNGSATHIIPNDYGDVFTLADSNLSSHDADAALISSFVDKFTSARDLLVSGDYLGASKIIDIDSFARYFLVSEIVANPDAYHTSCYFYMRDQDDLIHAGPIWDFDLAMGNYAFDTKHKLNDSDYFRFESPDAPKDSIYYDLYQFLEYRSLVKTIYNTEFRHNVDSIFNQIQTKADSLQEYASRDLAKWHEDSETPYSEYVSTLTTWLHERIEFLNERL